LPGAIQCLKDQTFAASLELLTGRRAAKHCLQALFLRPPWYQPVYRNWHCHEKTSSHSQSIKSNLKLFRKSKIHFKTQVERSTTFMATGDKFEFVKELPKTTFSIAFNAEY
jgi:hypothetical protein